MRFIERDGRQIATLWVTSGSRLDSMTALVFGDSIPPGTAAADTGTCVHRWLRLFPHPTDATFTAKLEWSYRHCSSVDTEVGPAVKDERKLQPFWKGKTGTVQLAGKVNLLSNTVRIDSITERYSKGEGYFYLATP
jgi:hypothetical protein